LQSPNSAGKSYFAKREEIKQIKKRKWVESWGFMRLLPHIVPAPTMAFESDDILILCVGGGQ
jgi:hypothetical protein